MSGEELTETVAKVAGRGKGIVGRMLWLPLAVCGTLAVAAHNLVDPWALLSVCGAAILSAMWWGNRLLDFAAKHPGIAALDDEHVIEHTRIEARTQRVLNKKEPGESTLSQASPQKRPKAPAGPEKNR